MTKEEFANKISGRDIVNAPLLTDEENELCIKHGLVVIYGASDDLMEMEGAISDEVSCYDGGEIFFDKEGILPEEDELEDDDEVFMQHRKRKIDCNKIFALWCQTDEFQWIYFTHVPNCKFIITDNNNSNEKFCQGIVFNIADLK